MDQTPELDRPQADSYGHFLSTLNPSRILPSDYRPIELEILVQHFLLHRCINLKAW